MKNSVKSELRKAADLARVLTIMQKLELSSNKQIVKPVPVTMSSLLNEKSRGRYFCKMI